MKILKDKRPIGVFDSGVGGLSVLKELLKLMPDENYIFLADQLNIPYGEKTSRDLERITLKVCDFLEAKRSKIIIAACNTATCYAIDFLRTRIKTPIVGTVPAIKPAAMRCKSGIMGVISTPATAKSKYLKNLIKNNAGGLKVLNIGCYNLENTVETGSFDTPEVFKLLLKYTRPIKEAGADTLVLGCTHYPFLKLQIKKILGKSVEIIDSGKAIARHVKKILKKSNANNDRNGKISFYTTGDPVKLSKVASFLLKKNIKAKHVSL